MRHTSWFAVVVVILLGSALGVAGGMFLAWWLPVARATGTSFSDIWSGPFGGQQYVRFLMIGEDDTRKDVKNAYGLSDTLVAVAIDTKTKEVRGISIPRDTRVEIPGHGVGKINSAYAFGGPDLTKQVVEDLLGVEMDYCIATSVTGLQHMVDLLGGVYIVVEQNMKYTDRRGGLYINLKASPEKQLLNGNQALQYVRFRHDKFGDAGYRIVDGRKVPAGRIVRQQAFMRALANRILALPNKRERANVLRQACEKDYIVSDMNLRDWDGFADFFKDIKPEEMMLTVLPGEPQNVGGGSYWVPDYEEVGRKVAQTLLFQGFSGDYLATIEVLNGSGIKGAAGKVAEKLERAGYQVARTDNATSFDYERCCVIARTTDSENAKRIADLLGSCDVKQEPNSATDIDVTVIVGSTYTD